MFLFIVHIYSQMLTVLLHYDDDDDGDDDDDDDRELLRPDQNCLLVI